MPRNMSFMLTTEQVRNRTKDVTRRSGWLGLKAGDVINACVKCMGLQPGETIDVICPIVIVNVRREPLGRMSDDPDYGRDEARREGFPELDGAGFVAMFCEHLGGEPEQIVTRIEFSYDVPRPLASSQGLLF